MKLLKKTYKNKLIFSTKDENFTLLQKIINNDFNILKKYKDDNRTFVAKIEINNKFYLLKKNFPRKKIKQFLTFFKDGECLTTLKNVECLRIEKKVNELVPCLGVIETRKNNIITEEILIMEFCEGKKPETQKDFLEILTALNKIYKYNRFHGDCNPNNFIIESETNNIKIIDTKLKPMWFGNYRKHFDYMVFKKHLPQQIKYPYHKNIYYYFALFIRKIRDFKNKFEKE